MDVMWPVRGGPLEIPGGAGGGGGLQRKMPGKKFEVKHSSLDTTATNSR